MEFNTINTTTYEGQMLSAALVIISTDLYPDKEMGSIVKMLEELRKKMGYETLQDKIIASAEATFDVKFTMTDTGAPIWYGTDTPL